MQCIMWQITAMSLATSCVLFLLRVVCCLRCVHKILFFLRCMCCVCTTGNRSSNSLTNILHPSRSAENCSRILRTFSMASSTDCSVWSLLVWSRSVKAICTGDILPVYCSSHCLSGFGAKFQLGVLHHTGEQSCTSTSTSCVSTALQFSIVKVLLLVTHHWSKVLILISRSGLKVKFLVSELR